MKSFLIHDDCWDADVWVLCPCDEAKLVKFVNCKYDQELKDDGDQWLGRSLSVREDGRELGHVIALAGWRNNIKWVAVLTHECLHATHHILQDRGVELNDDTSEAFAYLLDSLVSRAMKLLNK